MNLKQASTNIVSLTGRVTQAPTYSHQVCRESFYKTFLEVRRLSEKIDTIPIIISEKLVYDNEIIEGSFICVNGQFRSYNLLIEGMSRLMLNVFVKDLSQVEENKNPNTIELVGFICKEPIFRITPFKREVCDIILAVNRAYNKSDYIPCIVWGRNARYAKTLEIGDKIIINGRIQSRTYKKLKDNGEYEERVAYEVSIDRFTGSEENCFETYE